MKTIKDELLTTYTNLLMEELWWGHLRRDMWRQGKNDRNDVECRRVCDLEKLCCETAYNISKALEHFKDGKSLLRKEAESVYERFAREQGYNTWREFIMSDRAEMVVDANGKVVKCG